MAKGAMNTSIAIFGKRLLPYSETFTADQGQFLKAYQSLFGGYERDLTGLQLIEQSPKLLLADHNRTASRSKFAFRSGLPGDLQRLASLAEQNMKLVHAHFFNDCDQAA